MWSAIKGIFSADGVVDKVAAGVDKAIYTKEEQADMWEKLLVLYQPFKLAQRLIALSLLFLLGASWFIAVGVRLIGNMFCDPIVLLSGETARWWIEDSTWIATNATLMFGEPFLYAVVFYFAGGAGEGIVKRLSGRIRDNLTK